MKDPYVYPGTDILINKLHIQNQEQLDMAEADYVSYRLREVAITPQTGSFDFEHLCAYHQYLFQDVFEWAGVQRSIDIEKSEPVLGGLSIEYSHYADIKKDAEAILAAMRSVTWSNLSLDAKAASFSQSMAMLWKVHPFREGNTRSVVTFCCEFADQHGFCLDRDLFKDNSAYLRTALVAASAKFKDLGDLSQPQHLVRIVKDALSRGARQKIGLQERLKRTSALETTPPSKTSQQKQKYMER